jgi:hypothetical protein
LKFLKRGYDDGKDFFSRIGDSVDEIHSPDALVTAIGLLLDWERNAEIRAVAIASKRGMHEPIHSKVSAFSDGSFWTIRTDEFVAEYDVNSGVAWTYKNGDVETGKAPMNAIPSELWGLLPLKIPMWNRRRDSWRFLSAAWVAGGIEISLESIAGVLGRKGTVFVDTSVGIATHIQLGDVDVRLTEIVGASTRPPPPPR